MEDKQANEKVILKYFNTISKEWKSDYNLNDNTTLVHYTTAVAASAILKTQKFWLTEVSTKNDPTEMQHGLNYLIACLEKTWGIKHQFQPTLRHIVNLYQTHKDKIYFTSFSEINESDTNGNLPMWISYSNRTNGVALVLKKNEIIDKKSGLDLRVIKVRYDDFQTFCASVTPIFSFAANHLKSVPTSELNQFHEAFGILIFMELQGFKNSSYSYEKEWRFLYFSRFIQATAIDQEVHVIRSVPRVVQAIDFSKHTKSMNDLVGSFIVGPSQYQSDIVNALTLQMTQVGFTNPEHKVFKSNIPLSF